MTRVAQKSENKEIPYSLKSVHELTPNPRNARTHPQSQIDKLCKSIKRFGFRMPILVGKDGVVVAGHGRLEAAIKLGLERVPTLDASDMTESEARAYMLADNRLPLMADWNAELLGIELAELAKFEGFDLGITGFDQSEIDRYTSKHTKQNEAENDIPAVPAAPVSQLGDTWILGPHRVRCGDSTNPADVEILLQGAVPHLMVTDPPYGVEYDANFRNGIKRADGSIVSARAVGKVLNDDKADWTKAWELFPGDVGYVWCASMTNDVVIQSLERVGLERRAKIIWNKNQMAIGRGHFHWKHEECWYIVRAGGTGHWNGSRKETTVWDIDKPQKSETGHSTQKPVECMRRPILNNSKHGDKIYDPFLGSGTTLIAAETEGRVCYGQELNPAYVDVIVKRWQDFTGQQAYLEDETMIQPSDTNQSFFQISKQRLKAA
jgi:DNA modification methylase